MAQPTPYTRQYDFEAWQALNPNAPLPSANLEAEFDAVHTTLSEVLTNLKMIQADDGEVGRNTIGPDQLRSSVTLGFRTVAAWETGKEYFYLDGAWNGGKLYRCEERHTSGTFSTDLAAGKWILVVDVDTTASAYVSDAEAAKTAAETAQGAAEDAQSYAEEWANNAEDVPVSVAAGGDGATTFSARHWGEKAEAVAGIASAVSAVGAITTEVTTVAGNSADIQVLAGLLAEDADALTINADNIGDINAIAANEANINIVSGSIADVQAIAASLASSALTELIDYGFITDPGSVTNDYGSIAA